MLVVIAGGRRGKSSSRMVVFQDRRWESVMDMPFRSGMFELMCGILACFWLRSSLWK